jgi:hypothetical protein
MQISTCLIKISILEFYIQLFPQVWMQRLCHVQILLEAIFMVGQVVSMLTMCRPLAASFDFTIHGKCGNIPAFWLSIGVIAAVFGLAVVLTPMTVVWKLQLSREKRVKLMVLFGLGFWYVLFSLIISS